MKRNLITISDNGTMSVPDKVMMQDFEIAELFWVIIPTVRSNIRAILKSGVVTADMQHGSTFFGNTFFPDYYGLYMIMALVFRIQSPQVEIFRKWMHRKCIASELQPIILQYNYAQIHLTEQN